MKTIQTVQLAIASLVFASAASAQISPTPVGSYVTTTNPYNLTGRVLFNGAISGSYIGSGTVIKPSSVLTAAHCMYDRNGWSKNVKFERGRYDATVVSTSYASRLWVLGGYTGAVNAYGNTSTSAFDRDLGAFVCFSRPANGGYAGWWQNPSLLTGPSYNMSLGYGAVVHTGAQLLRSAPTRAFTSVTAGWYKNTSYGIEGGMSGGPVFAYNNGWWVSAVNVSGPAGGNMTSGAGVRIIDTDASTLIRNYLN